MDLLAALNHDRGLTTIMVTHDAEMAAYAHRIVQFVDGLVSSDEMRHAVAS
jgi:putative ABC transport system ATP-binding protein